MSKLKVLICFLLMFVFITNIFASCDNDELLYMVDDARLGFLDDEDFEYQGKNDEGETVTYTLPREYGYVLLLYPYSEKLRMEITDKDTGEEYPVEFSYKYLTYVMGSPYHYEDKHYVVKYYSNDQNACYGELLKTFDYTVPAYNNYSNTEFCKEHPETELCQVYTNTEELSTEEIEKMKEEVLKAEMSSSQIALLFIKKYWIYVILPIIIVSIYYRIKISNYKRKAEQE